MEFLSANKGEQSMGVYVCPSSRVHLVYGYFDVCMSLEDFKALCLSVDRGITDWVGKDDPFILNFCCSTVCITSDDVFRLRQTLDDALDKVVLLDIEEDLDSSPAPHFKPIELNLN